MVAFGKKIALVSSLLIVLWLCMGIFMYKRSFHLTDENVKVSDVKSPDQELFNCKNNAQKLSSGFWQRITLQKMSIPETVKESLSVIHIDNLTIKVQDNKVHYLQARPKKASNISVLLLHGQAFSSETWNALGTLRMIAAFGYNAVAVDLPGYGQSPVIPNLKKSNYIDDLISALNITKPVLISPSMSGSFSLKYLIDHPQKLGGYIPVSPVGTSILSHPLCASQKNENIDVYFNEDCRKVMQYLKSNELKLNCIKVPTLVVWGERDRGENSAKLCLLPESQGIEIPDGKHPAYLSNPDLWHKLLYNFLYVLNETEICR